MARRGRRSAADEAIGALHARACAGDAAAMHELAVALLEEFDEEHFDTERKRHVADLKAVLEATSTHDFARPPPARLSASARRDHAMHWLREAARRGHAVAAGEFAEWLFRAGAPFHPASLDGFEHAAAQGDLSAMLALGKLCWHGCEGAAADRARATPWLQRARSMLEAEAGGGGAAAGDALERLGHMHLRGEACAVDVDEARRCWQAASALGSAVAMLALGDLYLDGRAVDFDPDEAARWYERALAAGHTSARHRLEQLASVRAMRAQRDALRAQADAGDAVSALRLARHCEIGDDGGDVDAARATHYYRLAARRGHPLGMVETGKRLGELDEPAALREAWFWLRLAQRPPWATIKPVAAILAQAGCERVAPRLGPSTCAAIDAQVAALAVGADGAIDVPAGGSA